MVHSYNESDKNHGGVFMKKLARNVLAFALALTMAVPLAACKKSGKGAKGGSGKKNSVIAEDDPFFDAVEIPLDIETDANKKLQYKEISEPTIVGDRVFATYNLSYEMPQELMDKFDKVDCTNEAAYSQLMDEFNEYNEMGTLVFDLDGNLLSRTPSDNMESTAGNLAQLSDGSFVMIVSRLAQNECKTSTEIVKLNADFQEQSSVKIDQDVELGWDMQIIPMDNGNLLIADYAGIHIVSLEGKLIANESPAGFCGKAYVQDGDIYALIDEFDSGKNEDKFYFQKLDGNTGKPTGDRIATTFEAYTLIQGTDGIYSVGYSGLRKFDIPSGTSTDYVIEWNWTDINSGYISTQNATILSDDEMIFTKYSYEETDDPNIKVSGRDISLMKFKRAEKNPHAGKNVIVLGCVGAETPFRDYVIDYNKDPNHISRIYITDYADDLFASSDYMQALADVSDKVYLDMMSGDGPDILMNFYEFAQFNSEDILVDMNKFIDGQNGLNRADYFDNILRACETSGKLFQIPVCIAINGFAANPSLIGERTSWTFDEFDQMASSLPQNVSLISDTSRQDLMQMLLDFSMSSFVDSDKKEVSFDSADFRKLLEIAKKYGSDKTAGGDMGLFAGSTMDMEYADDSSKFAEGLIALTSVDICGVDDYARVVNEVTFKPTFIGMPGASGSGMAARAQMSFAISASSSHQDEAWDFIKFLYGKDCQAKFARSFWGLPIHKGALEEKNAEDVKNYNEFIEDYSKFLQEEGLEGQGKEMTKITDEMCADFMTMLEGVSVIKNSDLGIMAIVKEETAAFFENQKPVDDVVKIIQNRATTTVHER